MGKTPYCRPPRAHINDIDRTIFARSLDRIEDPLKEGHRSMASYQRVIFFTFFTLPFGRIHCKRPPPCPIKGGASLMQNTTHTI